MFCDRFLLNQLNRFHVPNYLCMSFHAAYCITSVHMCIFIRILWIKERKLRVALHRQYTTVNNIAGNFEKPGNEIYMCDSGVFKTIYQMHRNTKLKEIIHWFLRVKVQRRNDLPLAKASIFKYVCNRCRHKSN